MTTPNWEEHSTGQLLTTAQVVEVIAEHSGQRITAATWRSYQRNYAEEGLIPPQKAKLGNTALYDAGEVIHWAQNRLGRGVKSHVSPDLAAKRAADRVTKAAERAARAAKKAEEAQARANDPKATKKDKLAAEKAVEASVKAAQAAVAAEKAAQGKA